LDTLSWLDKDSKKVALKKVKNLNEQIAFPDTWRNYDSLDILPNAYLQNDINSNVFERKRNLAKADTKVDKNEWDESVWENNAFYSPNKNSVIFPLGGLIPPVFDYSFSIGANYGSGTAMGHELTHGFDSDGSQYDENGNLNDWWSGKTKEAFDSKKECLIEHANHYQIKEVNMHLDGKQIITENIADHGGVKMAFNAFKRLTLNTQVSKTWHSFDEAQQFFISYAQGYCTKSSQENLKKLILSNEHPPEEYRVNGVLSNTPEFAKSFSCKTGKALAPESRCSVW